MSDLQATTHELMVAQPVLVAIGDREMSIKAAYAFARQKRAAHAALEDAEAERMKRCRRYAKKDEAGEPMMVAGTDAQGNAASVFAFEDPVAFAADWKALLAETVTLPGCRAVKVSELSSADPSFTPDELYALGPLVIDDEPPTPAA